MQWRGEIEQILIYLILLYYPTTGLTVTELARV
jgi:hypothetical protein